MRTLLTIVAFAGAAYIAVGLAVFVLQGRLLYYPGVPGRTLDGTPGDIGLDFEELRFDTEDGITLHGWYIPALQARGVILVCHGNAGNISHRLDTVRLFHTLGFNVLIFDYRGYGLSAGRPSERGTYLDADAAWRVLVEQRGHDPGRVVVFGRSLGGPIAAQLARRRRPAAVIVESTFSSVPDVARRYYPWLPTRWLSRFRYDTAGYVRELETPLLVVHSRDDEIIPLAEGQRVFDAAQGEKALLEISGSHNDGFLTSGRRYVEGLDAFLTHHVER